MEKQAIIYARISTNKDKQNIKQQIEYCKKGAEREGYEVLKVFQDEKTGKTDQRRGYQRMLMFLEDNPVTLIVQDTDRISRNYYDSVEFEKFIIDNEIKVFSLSENVDMSTPNGRLMFRIKYALNAQYIENLVDKIRVGVARAKAEGGKYLGRKKGALGKKNNKRDLPKTKRFK